LGPVGASGNLALLTIDDARDVLVDGDFHVASWTQLAGSGSTIVEPGVQVTALLGVDLTATAFELGQNSQTVASTGVNLRSGSLLRMQNGASIDGGTGPLALFAEGDVTVGTLISSNLVSLVSRTGGILDAGDAGGADIQSPSAVLRARQGIGDSDALETDVENIAARNDGSAGSGPATGDIQVVNVGPRLVVTTVDSLAGVVNTGSGNVLLTSAGDVLVAADITTFGGQRTGSAASRGRIVVTADGEITLAGGVTVSTGTGWLRHDPPPVQVRLVPVDQGGSDVSSLGYALIEVTVNDPGANFQLQIDWSDGTIDTVPLSTSVDGVNRVNSGQTYRFGHFYSGNPDPGNPAAPIPVSVIVGYDGRVATDPAGGLQAINGITFVESGQVLSTTVDTRLTVPGTGLFSTIKVFHIEVTPVELQAPAAFVSVTNPVAYSVDQTEVNTVLSLDVDTAQIGEMRLFFRRVDASGFEGDDVSMPSELLEGGLIEVFQGFPNGHYRIYLQDASSDQVRVVRDVHVYQGRVVPADFREGVADTQPGSGEAAPAESRLSPDEDKGSDTGASDVPAESTPDEETEGAAADAPRPAADSAASPADAANQKDVVEARPLAVVGTAAVAAGLQSRWASELDRALQAESRSMVKSVRRFRNLRRADRRGADEQPS
jgi:hypothetical protein